MIDSRKGEKIEEEEEEDATIMISFAIPPSLFEIENDAFDSSTRTDAV